MPPIDVPCTCVRSTPISSSSPATSSAQSSIEYSCSGRSESPYPRRSNSMTLKCGVILSVTNPKFSCANPAPPIWSR